METISALRAVRSPNLHIAPVSGAISFIAQARRVPCIARPMPSWPRPFEGLTTEESIYQACIKRFHPILMTTMAALLGGVPMMVCKGGSALKLGSRSATPSSAASPCRRFSPSIRRRLSTSTLTAADADIPEKKNASAYRSRAATGRMINNAYQVCKSEWIPCALSVNC
jgi:hypothetical protein